MSGYLTRLAQRALGEAPAVHANASLPFAAPPEPVAEEETPTAPQAKAAAPRHDKPVRESPEEVVEPPVEQRKLVLGDSLEPPRRSPATQALAIPSGAAAAAMEEIGDRGAPPSSDASPDRAATSHVEHRAAVDGVPRLDAGSVSRSEVREGSRPTIPTRIEARTAMPRASSGIARARATLPPARETAETAPPPPDVHIHIGRIELTAVPEAPAPRRAQKAAKPPMSLDDYLRAKGGE